MVRSTLRPAVPALGLLAALAVAAPAAAGSTPTDVAPEVTARITTAITTSPGTAGVATDDYTVQDVRTAASDPTWAAARLEPTAPDRLDPATVVLRRVDGTWTVVSLGSAQVGCEETTPAVRQDLALLC